MGQRSKRLSSWGPIRHTGWRSHVVSAILDDRMKHPIIVFYHCLFELEGKLLHGAIDIVAEQMADCKASGLLDAASEFRVGMNEGDEGEAFRELFPEKANIVFHGLQCRNECRSILMMEQWLKDHPGVEAHILYFHAKGCTHPPGDEMRTSWRQCAMGHLVMNWRKCVEALESVESSGCHFMKPPQTPPSQYIWAGNFFWSRASFLRTLPSIMLRDRIKVSGIDALDSRYESEVWIGNGPQPPTIKDFCPNWHPGKPHTT